MNELDYFKSLFDREQIRKVELNNEVNIPLAIITFISGGVMLVFDKAIDRYCSFGFGLIVAIGLSLVVSILFLAKSYNNFFRGFKYDYLPDSIELYRHRKELNDYNKEVTEAEKESFEEYLIENYSQMNSTNMKINRKRLEDLYVSKTLVLTALLLTILLVFIYMINTLNQ